MTTLPISAVRHRAAPPAVPFEERMPFRFLFGPRANLAILLVLFVLTLAFICTLFAMFFAVGRNDAQARYELLKTIGIAGGVLGIMALLIRQQASSESARKERGEIKGEIQETQRKVYELAEKANGGLHKAVKEVGEQVRAAERDQVIADPKCKDAIADIVRETIAQMRGESR